MGNEGIIDKEKFWEYFRKWGVIVIIGVLGAIGITYIVINKIVERKKDKKEGGDIPKEYVNTHEAIIDTFIPAFIANTSIAYYIEDGKVKTNGRVKVRSTEKFSDPETGIPHIRFEVFAKEGTHKGINLVIIRLDEGLEKITKNWNSYVLMHTTLDTHKFSRRHTPLTKTQDENMRNQIYLMQEGLAGATEQELQKIEKILTLKARPLPTELSEEELEKINKKKELEENLQQKPKK